MLYGHFFQIMRFIDDQMGIIVQDGVVSGQIGKQQGMINDDDVRKSGGTPDSVDVAFLLEYTPGAGTAFGIYFLP